MLQVTANTSAENSKPAEVTKRESQAAVSLSQVKKHAELELDAYWEQPDLRSVSSAFLSQTSNHIS